MVGSRRVKGAVSARRLGREPWRRWSASRKRDVVLRLLRGESLDTVSRAVGVELYRLEAWQARGAGRFRARSEGAGR